MIIITCNILYFVDDKNMYVPKPRIDSILEIFGIPGLHLKNGKLDIIGIKFLIHIVNISLKIFYGVA